MNLLTGAEIAAGVLMLAGIICLVLLFLRRRWLSARGGVFDCDLRRVDQAHDSAWAMGLARYDGDRLEWYRIFSLSWRVKYVLPRGQTTLVGHRQPQGTEIDAMYQDAAVVQVLTNKGSDAVQGWELSMAPGSMVGLMSWLEAAPPGGASYLERA